MSPLTRFPRLESLNAEADGILAAALSPLTRSAAFQGCSTNRSGEAAALSLLTRFCGRRRELLARGRPAATG